jgi:hypothetical protein
MCNCCVLIKTCFKKNVKVEYYTSEISFKNDDEIKTYLDKPKQKNKPIIRIFDSSSRREILKKLAKERSTL